MTNLPPLPEGFVIEDPQGPEGFGVGSDVPPLPEGFVLEGEAQESAREGAAYRGGILGTLVHGATGLAPGHVLPESGKAFAHDLGGVVGSGLKSSATIPAAVTRGRQVEIERMLDAASEDPEAAAREMVRLSEIFSGEDRAGLLRMAERLRAGESVEQVREEAGNLPVMGKIADPEQTGRYQAGEQVIREAQERFPRGEGYEDKFFLDVVGSTASLLSFAGISSAVGPVGSFSFAGMLGAQEAYDRARANGMEPEEALDYAFQGVIPGAIEAAPAELILRKLPGGKRRNAMSLLRRVGEAFGGEFIVENSVAILQNFVEAQYNPDKQWHEGVPMQGVTSGTGAAGIQALFIALARRGPKVNMNTRDVWQEAREKAAREMEARREQGEALIDQVEREERRTLTPEERTERLRRNRLMTELAEVDGVDDPVAEARAQEIRDALAAMDQPAGEAQGTIPPPPPGFVVEGAEQTQVVDVPRETTSEQAPDSTTESDAPRLDARERAAELRRLADQTADPSLRQTLLRDAEIAETEAEGQKPNLTPAERARQVRIVRPKEDHLILAIQKLGGIDTNIDSDWGGRLSHLTERRPGLPAIERPGKGRSLDDLAESLFELGYIPSRDKAALEARLWDAEDGTPQYSMAVEADKVMTDMEQSGRPQSALEADYEGLPAIQDMDEYRAMMESRAEQDASPAQSAVDLSSDLAELALSLGVPEGAVDSAFGMETADATAQELIRLIREARDAAQTAQVDGRREEAGQGEGVRPPQEARPVAAEAAGESPPALTPPPGQVTQQARPRAEQETDLLGPVPTQQQALADRQRAVDERLSPTEEAPAPESAGDMLDPGRAKQTDITDAPETPAPAGVSASGVVEFTGNELGGLNQPVKALVMKARAFARRMFADKTVVNRDDGSEILIPWSGIKHGLSGRVSPNAALVSSKLDEVVESGRHVRTEADNRGRRNVREIRFYETPVRIAGEDTMIRVVVRETLDGKRYYDHFEVTGEPSPGGISGERPGSESHQPAPDEGSAKAADADSVAQEEGPAPGEPVTDSLQEVSGGSPAGAPRLTGSISRPEGGAQDGAGPVEAAAAQADAPQAEGQDALRQEYRRLHNEYSKLRGRARQSYDLESEIERVMGERGKQLRDRLFEIEEQLGLRRTSVKADGTPFKTEKAAMASRVYRDAVKRGPRDEAGRLQLDVEAIPVDGGYAVSIMDINDWRKLLEVEAEPVAQDQEAAKKPAEKSPEKPATKIEDFGETIEGARKHAEAYRQKLKDAEDVVDIRAAPLSKSWPEPDYQALIDEGVDPWIVGFVRAARDEIPAKPRTRGVGRWAAQVQALRDFSSRLLAGDITRERIESALNDPKYGGLRDSLTSRIDLYVAVGHEKSLKGVRISAGRYSLHEGKEYDPPKVIWTVEKQAKATAFGNWPRTLASGDTREQAIAAFKKAMEAGLEVNQPAGKNVRFDIYSYRTGPKAGKWIVGKKIGRDHVDLAEFETVAEARAYRAEHQADLEAKLAKMKEIPDHRKQSNAPRVGDDHRHGADVTPEMFAEAFGFRGVQFGNWVEQGKRQQDLNDAYDALMDLAGVIGVPPRALSLNGELGLAFGARGHGRRGKSTPKAHYERGEIVINLTKKQGAGSLAHEWWHALDNYFARARQQRDGFLTETPYKRGPGVRPEVVEAFNKVVRAINRTRIQQRSRILDRTRSNEYWSTGREMSARAFESYVIEKLKDQGQSNDYLANIVSEDYWNAAAALGMEKEGTYPYPEAAEIPVIRAAFDNFFEVVEARDTESGVALFSFAGPRAATADGHALITARSRIEAGENAETVRKETGWFRGADGRWRFEIDDSEARLGVFKHGKLHQVLSHPKLFAAYPGLADIDVAIQYHGRVSGQKDGGSYSASANRITVDVVDGQDRGKKALSILLHEVQHGIQRIEGFARGGSPQMFRRPAAMLADPEVLAQAEALIKWRDELGKTIVELTSSKPPRHLGSEWHSAAMNLARNPDRLSQFRAELERAQDPQGAYERLAGEVEARNVQTRRDMTEAERRELAPEWTTDVDAADVIVVFNGQEALSAPPPANAGPEVVTRLTGHELDLSDGSDIVRVARDYFRENLQGRTLHRPEIGDVRVTGKGWRKFKRGVTTDVRKVQLLPALPSIIESGRYHGREVVTGRTDDIVAFHFFDGHVEIAGAQVQAGVTVAEDSFGNLFYNLNHDADALWEKRRARLLPGSEARDGEPSAGSRRSLGVTVDQDAPTVNIAVLRVAPVFGAAPAGMSTAQVRTHANRLMRGWADRPSVVVVQSESDLPAAVQRDIAHSDGQGRVNAVYHQHPETGKQTVYVVADRMADSASIEQAILHEVVGHYGLRRMIGRDLLPVLNQVYLAFGRTEAARRIRDEYFPNNTFDASNAEHRQLVAEELIAHIAQTGAKPNLMQRVLAAINNGLRRLGFTVQITRSDLLDLIRRARLTVERGGLDLAPEGVVAMSRPMFQRQAQMDAALQGFVRQEADLSARVDAAFEAGDIAAAEALDAELAELRDRMEAAYSEYIAESGETGVMADSPDFEAGLDEMLANAWAQYQDPGAQFGGDRDAVIANMRDAAEFYGATNVTGQALLDAARDAYEVRQGRRGSRQVARFSRGQLQGFEPGPRIESHIGNMARGRAFFDSVSDVLHRQPRLRRLADAIDNYYDGVDKYRGEVDGHVRPVMQAIRKLPRAKQREVFENFKRYQAAKENGRKKTAETLRETGGEHLRSLIEAWEWVADHTGEINQKAGVEVYDPMLVDWAEVRRQVGGQMADQIRNANPKDQARMFADAVRMKARQRGLGVGDVSAPLPRKGGWRRIGRVKGFWPRAFRPEVQEALHNPARHPELWNQMVDALIAEGHIGKADEAGRYLRQHGESYASDYFAGIEKARTQPLPEMFYDYSWDSAMVYKEKWARRVSQIEQFGQKKGDKQGDLFGEVLKEVHDERTRNYLIEVMRDIYMERPVDATAQFIGNLNIVATGIQLGNPFTATRNWLTGMIYNWANYGSRPSILAFGSMIRDINRAWQNAYQAGVLKEDLISLLHDAEQQGVSQRLSKGTSFLMRWGGYNISEQWVRVHAMLTGRHFLLDALRHWNRNIASAKSKRYLAFMQRHNIDTEALIRENGVGPETDKWLRLAVNIPQGSYKLNMVPLFVDTPICRFLWKYQKYGTQRSREFWQNGLRPFIKGDAVAYTDKDGVRKSERVRSFEQLLRYFVAATVGGTATAKVLEVLFGTIDPGPGLDELEEALKDEDRKTLLGLLFARAWHSAQTLGALGFFQAPIQATMDVADRQRMKSPLSPPGLAPIEAVGEMILRYVDQGGVLTARDIDNTLNRTLSMYRASKRAGLGAINLVTDEVREAQLEALRRDRLYVRKLTRRYAAESDLRGKRRASGSFGATEMTPVNRRIHEEILLGNAETARQLAIQAMRKAETNRDVVSIAASIKASVRAFDPARVSTAPSEYERAQFLEWVEGRVSDENYQRVRRITDTYRDAAIRAGLMSERHEIEFEIETLRRQLNESLPREMLINRVMGFSGL